MYSCLKSFILSQRQGFHCESRVYTTIFLLLFYDILFPVEEIREDVFFSLRQTAPLDLFSGDFYENHRTLVEGRLNLIASAQRPTPVDPVALSVPSSLDSGDHDLMVSCSQWLLCQVLFRNGDCGTPCVGVACTVMYLNEGKFVETPSMIAWIILKLWFRDIVIWREFTGLKCSQLGLDKLKFSFTDRNWTSW